MPNALRMIDCDEQRSAAERLALEFKREDMLRAQLAVCLATQKLARAEYAKANGLLMMPAMDVLRRSVK